MVLSLVLLLGPLPLREGIAHGIRATVLRPVLALQAGAVERHARFDDPDRLRSQRDSLAAFLVGQAALSTENRELRALLGLRGRVPRAFVPAEVIRMPTPGSEGFFQLTAGADQGVQVGAPIIAPGGLVGRVRSTDRAIAFGIDWMHPDFRASAMTLDGTVYGIVEPRLGPGGQPLLALTGTPRHVQLKTGTLLVTSGHGGVFPRGVPIGTVSGVEGKETSWQRTYLVQPSVSPAEMTYVLVLGAPQQTLSGTDLATAWGIRAAPAPVVDTAAAAALAAAAAQEAASRRETVGDVPAPQPRVTVPAPRGPRLLGTPVRPGTARPDTTNRRRR